MDCIFKSLMNYKSKFSFGKGDRRLVKHAKMTLMQLEGNLLHWQSIFTLVMARNSRMML